MNERQLCATRAIEGKKPNKRFGPDNRKCSTPALDSGGGCGEGVELMGTLCSLLHHAVNLKLARKKKTYLKKKKK